MLSGHSRHTHYVSVPNISVMLHTHVEAVLKFEVVSHFAHFWSHFSTDFHIWPTKSKLRASSTTWRCFCNVLVPVRGWKMAKNVTKIANNGIFAIFYPLTATKTLQKHLHVVEEALSFNLVGHMWKSVEKWLQKWAKCETTSNFNIVSTRVCGRAHTIIIDSVINY